MSWIKLPEALLRSRRSSTKLSKIFFGFVTIERNSKAVDGFLAVRTTATSISTGGFPLGIFSVTEDVAALQL